MYQVESNKLEQFEQQIDNPNRKISYKFTLNSQPLQANQIMDNPSVTYDLGLEQYGVGCAIVGQLQMSVNSSVSIKPKDEIAVSVGLETKNTNQQTEIIYVPLGIYYVDVAETKGVSTLIKAYDGMYKLNEGYFPTARHTTTQAIANDIASANGYGLKGVSNVSINNEQLEGKTAIEMLSLLAGAMGSHVRISRDGSTIEFITPTNYGSVFTESDYSTPTIDDATQYNITKLRINYSDQVTDDEGKVTDEGFYEVGTGTDAQTLVLSNPMLKGQQSQAQAILTKIKALNGYKRFDTKLPFGDFRLDPMDTVSYFHKDKMYVAPILYMKMVLSYSGISIETQSPVLAETKTEFEFKGTLSQKVENIYTDIIQVKQLTAGKVSTDELEATVATIEKLYAQKADIEELYATKAEIGDLVAGSIVVEDLKAQVAQVESLVANKAEIKDLEALNATIGTLKADVAEIDDLISNSIISGIIQSGSISSDLLNIKNGFIKDAMIDSVTASKINSGVINTNNVTIQSNNGNMKLQGNLLQFKDKNGKVRIQIGQDTTGNYTFTLYDETGTGVLINEKGIQSSNAIKDGLIVDSKVSSNANISGSKLNISSVYDEMNKDGSKTLKASKVMLNEQNQTLDVSFKEMTTKTDELEDSMSTAITDISVAQGQISQLIQDTTITTSSGTTTLKDAYNSTKSTVDSHTTQIGEMQTTIDTNTGEITNVKSDVATISADLDEIELSLSSVEKNIGDNYYTKTQTDTAIKFSKDAIELGISEKYETKEATTSKITTAIDDIRVGGRNILIRSVETKNTYIDTVGNVTTVTGFATSDFIEITSGETLAFSRDKTTTDGYFRWAWYGSDKSYINRAPNNSEKFLWIVPDGASYVRISYPMDSYPKVERGNKWTDYSQAPEDVETSITNAETNAVSTSNSYTDSQIKLTKESIELSVSNTYETKENVTSKVSTALSDSKEYTDTAKNDLNTAINKKANSTDVYTKSETDSAIKLSKESIELSVSDKYETKTEVTNKINAVQVGGTNLLDKSNSFNKGDGATGITSVLNSDGTLSITATSGNGNWFTSWAKSYGIVEDSMNEGDIFTISFTMKSSNATSKPTVYIKSGIGYYPMIGTMSNNWSTFYYTGTWKKANEMSLHLGFSGVVGTIDIKNWKIEKGNKPTTWSPSVNDVESSISTAQSTAISESKSYADSQIKLATDSITSLVSNTYETKTNVSALKNQINQTIQNVRCNDLGAKINYSAFSAPNTGEIYLHGYDDNNNPTDTNGTIYWNGVALTVTKGMINPDSNFPFNTDVYIFINKTTSSTRVYGCYYNTSTKAWAYMSLIGGTDSETTWSPNQNHVALGVFNMASAEAFNHAYLFETPQSLIVLTVGADNLTSRMNSAEQKITSDAIVSTVTSSKTYTDAMTGKVNKTEVISSINQTAETVKINANKIELTGDVVINAINGTTSTAISGNKIKTGVISSPDGTLTFDLNNAQMCINDGKGGLVGSFMRNTFTNESSSVYGMTNCVEYNNYVSMSVKVSQEDEHHALYLTCVAQDNLIANYLSGVNVGKPLHVWSTAKFNNRADFLNTYAFSHRANDGYFDTLRTNTSPNDSSTEINALDSINMNLYNIRNSTLKWDGFSRSTGDMVTIEKLSTSTGESHLRVVLADDYYSWFTIAHNHVTLGMKTVCNFGYSRGITSGIEASVGIKMWKTLDLNNWGICNAGTINGATVNALALNLESDTVTVQSSSPLVLSTADDFTDIDVPTKTQYMMTSTTNTINHHGRIEVLDKAEYIELPSDFLMCKNINVVATPNKICKFAITSIDEYGFVIECDELDVTFTYQVVADKIDIMTLTERKSNIEPTESSEEESKEKPVKYEDGYNDDYIPTTVEVE